MESSQDNDKQNTTQLHNIQSSVDTSRPFRSVKEAVAVFGERIQLNSSACDESTHSRSISWNKFSTPCSPITSETTPKQKNDMIMDALKKVEAELEETKAELRMLKEREHETEVAVAALNAELHKSMSRLAEAEAEAAARARGDHDHNYSVKRSEEEKRRELKKRMEKNTTLAQILSLGLGENDMNMIMMDNMNYAKKIKPIVPLVGDLLSSLRKGSPTSHHNLHFSAPAHLFH